jgi:SAM-dependent methyltransferase
MSQETLDRTNAEFWNMLCGWSLAQSAGITGSQPGDLRRFDELYLTYYPYLLPYVENEPLAEARVLEIGLGYGTLGQLLAERAGEYHAVDVAEEPVAVMRKRLEWLGQPAERARQGSALELPYEESHFDLVYSIGCLHHTGDLPRAVDEVHRVLRPGGRAVIMVYNRHSLRQLVLRARAAVSRGRRRSAADVRALYDADQSGAAAPHTDFVSRSDVRRLFGRFADVRIDVRNFDAYGIGPIAVRREWFLGTVDRVLGLDLYVVADKPV